MTGPVEAKVTAATAAAAVVTLVMYGLSFVPFVADMPPVAAGAVLVLVTGGVTFGAGWLAKHTPSTLERDDERTLTAARLVRHLPGHYSTEVDGVRLTPVGDGLEPADKG